MIEDNPADARMLDLYLNNVGNKSTYYYEIKNVGKLQDGIECLQQDEYDLLILDLSLPDSFGLDTFKQVESLKINIPVIVMTGYDNQHLGVNAVKLGAQDFLSKNNLEPEVLTRSVLYAIERSKVEKKLQVSEERFRNLFRYAPIGMVMVDRSGRFLDVNPALIKLLGYFRQEFLQKKCRELTYTDDYERELNYIRRIREGRINSYQIEKRYIHKNGNLIWTLLKVSAVRDEQGNIKYTIGQILDITERKRYERQLAANEKRYRTLFHSIKDEILVYQIDYDLNAEKFYEVNDAACEMLGYTREELLQKSIYDISGFNVSELETIGRLIVEDKELVIESEHIRKDGSRYPVEVNGHLFEMNGKLTVLTIARDISDRKIAEENLRKEKNFVKGILDTAGALIIIMDSQGRILRFNEMAREITGFNYNEVVGEKVNSFLIPENERESVDNILHKLLNGEKHRLFYENEILTKDGDRRIVSWTNTILTTASEEVEYVVSVGIDVTERRKIEQELYESEAKNRAIIENTKESVITVNSRGYIDSFNKSSEMIFGYDNEEIINQHIEKLIAPSSIRNDEFQNVDIHWLIERFLSDDTGQELNGIRKNGDIFPMEISLSKVELDKSEIYTFIIRDISERRELEQQILEISENERRRIGQDLHDGLGQMLTGIGLITENLARQLETDKTNQAGEAYEIAKLIHDADVQARGLARGLLPVDLDDEGLVVALQRLADNAKRMSGISCKLSIKGIQTIPEKEMAIHLYRIAQEAMNNAIKHGKATEISLNLINNEDQLILRIQDNGVGFPDNENKEPGMGVRIMHYRARIIGGRLKIDRDLLGTTIVSCIIPKIYESTPS